MSNGAFGEHWSRARRRLRTGLAVALTAVGIARGLGFYSGVFPLSVLGAQFGASPLPLVFTQVHGVETYSRRFAVELEITDGARRIISGDARLVRALRGPFTRVKTYVDELAFA